MDVQVLSSHPHIYSNGQAQGHLILISTPRNTVNAILDSKGLLWQRESARCGRHRQPKSSKNRSYKQRIPKLQVAWLPDIRHHLQDWWSESLLVEFQQLSSNYDICNKQVNTAKVTVHHCKDELFIIIYTFMASETQHKKVKFPKASYHWRRCYKP